MATSKRDFEFDENIIKTIAYNVIKYRKMAKITQEQLAVDISMSPDYLRRFESQKGKEGLSLYRLYQISIVLNTPMDKFFEKEEIKDDDEEDEID